ncbi:M24 family metallopeptidase [Halohasta litorea]|uniref:M24 family metallopeptidase n=1 Tax=Halohasta litorea TaxID=869891 RepID=A0ABD6D4U4_9EURY|nr:M24 family metallopeptidase [Halohasta litorea]
MSPSSRRTAEELSERRARITTFLDDRNMDALWLGRPTNFTWLTGGSNVVDRASAVGAAAAGYSRTEGFRVLTNTIEAPRLRDEELPEAFTVTAADWYTDSLAEFVAAESPASAAADFDVPGLVQPDLSTLRQPLSTADIDRYRGLGRETAAAVEEVCRELSPTQTEQAAAVDVRTALESRGIEAPVVLVGGGERAQQYRHYTPTTAPLGDYALVSVTAQRGGLYASTTRTVDFDAPAWLDERFEAAARVEVSALSATQRAAREGSTAGEVFGAIQSAYEAVGWPDEWHKHHQGGAAGFAGREWIATPTDASAVLAPQGYAWNPTVQGTKSEGTVLVTADTAEPLTMTDSWPTRSVSAVEGDLTLQRPVPLSV